MCLPGAKDRNSLLLAFYPQVYFLLSRCFLFFLGLLQLSQVLLARLLNSFARPFSRPASYSQGCILSPCLFNLQTENIMRNFVLDEAQAWIKITGRNINNLRYTHEATHMAESKEELKSFLTNMREGGKKCWLKTQHSEN